MFDIPRVASHIETLYVVCMGREGVPPGKVESWETVTADPPKWSHKGCYAFDDISDAAVCMHTAYNV